MSSSEDDVSFYSVAGDMQGDADDWPGRALGNSHFDLAATPPANTTTTRQAKDADGGDLNPRNKYSLPGLIPTVPEIPDHLLLTGKRATVVQRKTAHNAQQESKSKSKPLKPALWPAIHIQRPSTSEGEGVRISSLQSTDRQTPHNEHDIAQDRILLPAIHTRRKSLPALSAKTHKATLEKLEERARRDTEANMKRLGRERNDDLFLELANDQVGAEDGARPPSRSERASSRLSFAGKRRSLPSQMVPLTSADLRPKTSGGVFGHRPPSRLDSQPSDLQRHMERYKGIPGRAAFPADDAVSVSTRSRSGRPNRYPGLSDTVSTPQPAGGVESSELPHYGRRRPSLGTEHKPHRMRPSQLSAQHQETHSESPGDSSEPKQSLPDSASAESENPDTVWDELDDLKSRIKKLELTGKLPPTSGAAVSNETSDRPRTATTAPTTIDSSPKHESLERKPEPVVVEPEDMPVSNAVSGPNSTNIHPFLHSALAKAKPLLNASLYRSLEATAADALQLAAMTGTAGPQGTTYSAAAIINGVTAVDRQVRRKADTMCRNLTDLCLALCEGKHEGPSIASSPVTLGSSANNSPTIRYPRPSLDPNDGLNRNSSRPMSRLEARRVSILGSQVGSSLGNSPTASGEELSASEHESTPSNLRFDGLRRFSSSRAGSRLHASRLRRREEVGEDDDPPIRPASRALTGIGRAKPTISREFSTPQRSPSLHDSLVARQANAGAYEGNRELNRVVSHGAGSGSHRRFHDLSTIPVEEEEGIADDYHSVLQSKRRVLSAGQYASRRKGTDSSRTPSLVQRRQIAVE